LSKIFVSHSSRDSLEAIGLVDWLAEAGWSEAFLDLDPDAGSRRASAGSAGCTKLRSAARR
jgi:hypothetical protein